MWVYIGKTIVLFPFFITNFTKTHGEKLCRLTNICLTKKISSRLTFPYWYSPFFSGNYYNDECEVVTAQPPSRYPATIHDQYWALENAETYVQEYVTQPKKNIEEHETKNLFFKIKKYSERCLINITTIPLWFNSYVIIYFKQHSFLSRNRFYKYLQKYNYLLKITKKYSIFYI
jgi:hypothetical protein